MIAAAVPSASAEAMMGLIARWLHALETVERDGDGGSFCMVLWSIRCGLQGG